MSSPKRENDVAIVGMACVFPGAANVGAYWRNIVEARDAITEVPEGRWEPIFYDPEAQRPDRLYCKRGGFVDDNAWFDSLAWGIMPVAVGSTEPDQLLCLEVASRAFRDAGYGGPGDRYFPRQRTGVVLGRGGYINPAYTRLIQMVRVSQELVNCLERLLPDLPAEKLEEIRQSYIDQVEPVGSDAIIGLVPNLAASRIANRLDLQGASYTVDAACASSLIAVERGCEDLIDGRSDLVLAGGVHLIHDATFWSVFCQLGAMSRNEEIRPFDRRADGLLAGEGVGAVVLKRLADAERDGDRIYAVVRGVGTSSDGRESSLMQPRVEGQMLALERAWKAAGIDPREPSALGLVEAHGTGTPNGDAAELETLARFFGPAGDAPRAGLGTVKSMIGHAMPAAGIAGLIKAALAVHHGVLPPTLHCDEPHPAFEPTRFRPIREAEPWEANGEPCRAAVNAFGFGGINCHVVIEQAARHSQGASAQASVALGASSDPASNPAASHPASGAAVDTAPGAEPSPATRRLPALLLAADTPAELLAALETYERSGAVTGARSGPCRLAVLDPTPARLARAHRAVEIGKPFRGRKGTWFTPSGLIRDGGKVAFLFPGVDAEFEPRIDDVEAFFGRRDYSTWRERFATDDLQDTGIGIVQLSRLLDDLLKELGLAPDMVAGHSIGEWTGMVSAGMVTRAEADALLESLRPDMLEVPGIAYAAAGGGREKVEPHLEDLPDIAVSHDNCPHQVVLCGIEESIDEAVRRLTRAGVFSQKLGFQSGFHSPFFADWVEPVEEPLTRLAIEPVAYPLWSATTCAPYPAEPEAVRQLFVRHLLEEVRFRDLIGALYDAGARLFVQVGTGSLIGFVSDILAGRPHLAMSANHPQHSGVEQLARLLAAGWVEGADVDLARLLEAPEPRPASSRRLPLGAPLVQLTGDVRLAVQSGPSRLAAAAAGSDPVLSAFAASFEALDASQGEVLSAWQDTGRQPARRGGSPRPASPPAAGPAPLPAEEPADEVWAQQRHISLEECPFLIDHTFFRQPAGWPLPADRFPTVPLTMSVGMMIRAAEELAARAGRKRVAISLREVRARRWMEAGEPIDITIESRWVGPELVAVKIGDYIECQAVLAEEYPKPPPPDRAPLADSRPTEVTAEDMYQRNWTFHGPAYQGVQEITEFGDDGFRGTLEVLPAEGALFDACGQLLGTWIAWTTDKDRMALPVVVHEIHLYGPHPPTGAICEGLVRIVRQGTLQIEADLEILHQGKLWLRADRWTDQRFATDDRLWEMIRYPEHNLLSYPQSEPPDACWFPRGFHSSGLRDLMARRYVTASERAVYLSLDFRTQVDWLSARVAVKDAIRDHLWRQGGDPLFPVELESHEEAPGRFTVTTPSGELEAIVDVVKGRALARVVAAGETAGVGVAIVGEEGEQAALEQASRRAATGDLEVRTALADETALAWTVGPETAEPQEGST
jgi:acyl transferase domain-containing protein